jgi:hypothetical protein
MQYRNQPGTAVVVPAITAQYLLLKFDGSLCAANATKDYIGVSMESRAAGKNMPVRFTKAGTIPCTAAAAITAGAIVYKDALGTVGVTNTNARVGIALETVANAGDFLEVLPD